MRLCKVSRGHRKQNGDPYIQIDALNHLSSVKLAFKTQGDFLRWGLILVESNKKDRELHKQQVLEPLQRMKEEEEQRRLSEIQEIELRKSRVTQVRQEFEKQSKLSYLGKFLNYHNKVPWEPSNRQDALNLLSTWSQKTPWHLAKFKDGVHAFVSDQSVDLSIKRIITEDYGNKI